MFPSEESVYRLLQRHRCRPGTCSGRLQCADMEIFVGIRFLRRIYDRWFWDSFSDTSCTANLVFFASEPFILSSVMDFTVNFTHRQFPCISSFRTFLMLLVVVFVDFCCVMKVDGWFVSIAVIMTSDFLLYLMFYRIFDRIFLQKLSLKLFLRCNEPSFRMYSNLVFFISFWIFLSSCNVKTVLRQM